MCDDLARFEVKYPRLPWPAWPLPPKHFPRKFLGNDPVLARIQEFLPVTVASGILA